MRLGLIPCGNCVFAERTRSDWGKIDGLGRDLSPNALCPGRETWVVIAGANGKDGSAGARLKLAHHLRRPTDRPSLPGPVESRGVKVECSRQTRERMQTMERRTEWVGVRAGRVVV